MNKIGFNIWDDYYDIGNAPPGEKEGYTWGYVEGDYNENIRKDVAKIVFDYINNHLNLKEDNIQVSLEETDVVFTNLSHENREKLIEVLEKSNLKYKKHLILFYSES